MEATPIIDFLLSSYEAKEKTLYETYKKLRTLDILTVASSFLGLIIFQTETNTYYEQISEKEFGMYGASNEKLSNAIYYKDEEENYQNFVYRVILLASTCFLAYLLILRANVYLFYLKLTNRIELGATFYTSGILFTLILELVFNFLISYPKYNYNFSGTQQDFPLYYSLDQIMSLFQFGRLYVLVRMWTQYSKWNKDKSILICNLCNTDGGVMFAMKAEFKNNPILVFAFLFTITVFVLGFATRTCERSYSYVSGLNWDYAWNGIWMIIIIISTVGYGDFFAKTYMGRVFVFFTCCFGPFLISLVNVSISNYLFFNQRQYKAFERIDKQEDYNKLLDYASDCIKISIRYWGHLNLRFKSSRTSNSQKKFCTIFNKYKDTFLKFHQHRLHFYAEDFNKRFDEVLPKFTQKQDNDFFEVLENLNEVMNKMNFHIDKINMNHDLVDSKMSEVTFKYEILNNTLLQNPKHQSKYIKFCSKFNHLSTYPSNDDILALTFNEMTSLDSIKEIAFSKDKLEKFESQMSSLNIQSPLSAKSVKRNKKDTSIIELNDIVKQLTKKKKFELKECRSNGEDDSPKMKPSRNRAKKSTTIMSNLKKTDGGLEPIGEEEETKEIMKGISSIIKDAQHIEPKSAMIQRQTSQTSRKKKKNQTILHDLKDDEERSKMILNKFNATKQYTSPNIPQLQTKPMENRQEFDEKSQQSNNFSVNFSSQMQSNMPFNMSVNVNTTPLFNLSTNLNGQNYPLIINVESKKIDKSPIYPENNILEGEVKTKNSSFKMDESGNTDKNENPENNNLFRQRKIVIEHSMLITESIIQPNSYNSNGNLPKPIDSKGIFDNNENVKMKENLSNVD